MRTAHSLQRCSRNNHLNHPNLPNLGHLQEWMTLLSGLRTARGLHRAAEVQRCVALQLSDAEGPLQVAVLKCVGHCTLFVYQCCLCVDIVCLFLPIYHI